MSDTPIPTPEAGPMDVDTATDFIFAPPPAAEPIEEEEVEAAPDAEEAEEAAPDEISDEPEGDPTDEADEVAEESDPDDADEVEYVVVKVNGEEREVTLEEAISGYSRTEDYKAKTRDLAEDRRQFEAEKKAAQDEIAQARALYASQLESEPEEPDWDSIREEDPLGYAEKWADWQRAKNAREAERARVQSEINQHREQVRAESARAALEVFPEWGKQGEYLKGEEARKAAALAAGFSEAELEQNHDYRAIVLLEKAARYDALMAEKQGQKAKVLKKVRKAPPRMKAGARKARNTAAEVEAARRERLRKTGSVDDAVAFILEG